MLTRSIASDVAWLAAMPGRFSWPSMLMSRRTYVLQSAGSFCESTLSAEPKVRNGSDSPMSTAGPSYSSGRVVPVHVAVRPAVSAWTVIVVRRRLVKTAAYGVAPSKHVYCEMSALVSGALHLSVTV